MRSNLKAILEERNVSIRQLSQDIDYRFETVRKLYNNELKRYPDDLLDRICSYLDITLNDLFTHEKKQ